MKIFIKAKPGAKEESIKKVDGLNYIISVKEPPIKGRANQAIIRVLVEYFKVSQTNINIVSGWSSRSKVIEIK